MLDRVALSAAERVAKSAGPRAGLVAFEALVKNTAAPETRGAAILRAIECALDVKDGDAAARLAAQWDTVSGGSSWEARVVEVAARLADAGLVAEALGLARAEETARPRARVAYLVARLYERAGAAADAAAAYEAAEARAEREGRADTQASARLRRAAIVARASAAEAAEVAKAVDAGRLAPAQCMQLATILLGSRSRFVRATGLGHLERLAASGDEAARARASAIALEHAERSGRELTPLESDRVAAILKHGEAREVREAATHLPLFGAGAFDEGALATALERSPAGRATLQRARAVLAGAGRNMTAPPPVAASPEAMLGWLALDACAAVQDQNRPAAARALLEMGRLCEAGRLGSARVPRPVWTAIQLGLGVPGMVQKDALDLARKVLALPAEPPARGFAPLGAALARAGQGELAELALRAGVRAREAAAARTLFEIVRWRAWQAAKKADSATTDTDRRAAREEALALLREAATLAT